MKTLLAKKSNVPTATTDTTYEQLVADPEVHEFVSDSGQYSSQYEYQSHTHRAATEKSSTVLTSSGTNAAQDASVLVNNDNSDWINKRWRPVMGWSYTVTCITDFVLFPVLWSLLQALSQGSVTEQWQPLTLQGAGLYHIAMGAILGIAVYGRTQEKIAGKS
jgi:hypothetical protein